MNVPVLLYFSGSKAWYCILYDQAELNIFIYLLSLDV